MNYRSRCQRRQLGTQRDIQWKSSYTSMNEKQEDNEGEVQLDALDSDTSMNYMSEDANNEIPNEPQSQLRTFYNGRETSDQAQFERSRFQSRPSSSQKYSWHKNERKAGRHFNQRRGCRGNNRSRANFRFDVKDRSLFKINNNRPSCSNNSSSDSEEDNITSFSQKSRTECNKLQFLPNCVNIDKGVSKMESSKECLSENISEIHISDNIKDKLQEWRSVKERYFKLLESISPSDMIMDYRQQIETLSNEHMKQNLAKIETISKIMSNEKTCVPVLKLHYENLELQQKNFDAHISSMKRECSIIHDKSMTDIIKKADNIKMRVENECSLFKRTLPAYAYKSDILNALKKFEVIIIPADGSYFFNVVCPIIVASELPPYFVVSCENSKVSCEFVRNDIDNIMKHQFDSSSITCITEDKMSSYLKENLVSSSYCFIISLPLKRTVTSDLLLANLRDYMLQKKDCKLILLLSVFDNTENYKKFFSELKVSLLDVPKLLLPVKTVWKKEPLSVSKNYKEDVVCTALSISILNEPGNILAFLPSVAEAKAALAMFCNKVDDLNYNDIEGLLFHENTTDTLRIKTAPVENNKRTVYFTTSFAEAMPFPSIRYVIDCGLTRDYIFDSDKNIDILTTVFNSRAKSRLRKSLVGVYAAGTCYRIYNKENFCNDMKSFELPDILTLNPFNTLITIFFHEPEKALSLKFIEPLSDVVKDKTVKLLKNFNAIKNGKLSQFGMKMGELPFTVRHSKLILQSIEWGFAYEAVILVAFFSIDSNLFKYTKIEEHQQVIDASKIGLIQDESDTLSFLYIFKSWIENKCSEVWCSDHNIEYNTLNEVKMKVDEICQIIYECLNENVLQEFSNCENATSSIVEMLFQCFADNLCVFSGHYRCGYRILSSRQTAFLHPSSILCNKENAPELIIFNKIINTSRNFLLGITAIPADLVLRGLTEKTLEFEYSDIFERKLVSDVIEPIGERIINQVLLGKKGKKLFEIEQKIKQELNSEMLVVDPCVEKGCIYVYALQPVLNAAVKKVREILKNNVHDIINAEQSHILEFKSGKVTIPIEVKCVRGARIVSIKLKDISSNLSGQNSNVVSKTVKDTSAVQCSINLTWVRRVCSGICYVSFIPTVFAVARKIATTNIMILGSEVFVRVSKRNEFELILTDVPQETRVNDVTEALKKVLPGVKTERIELKFAPPFETTASEIDKFKMEIQDICDDFTDLIDFEVTVPKPSNSSTIMTAYVNVFGMEDLTEGAKNLSNALIRNFKVTAIPVYRSVIKCNFKIYKALELRIQSGIDKLKEDLGKMHSDKDPFRFETDHIFGSDLVLLKLISNDIKIMKTLQKTINKLLEGEILNKDIVNDIHKLFCHGGHMWLKTLAKSRKVHIIEEYNSKTIRVYGSRESCFRVKESILDFLEDTESEAVERIVLSSEKNNRSLLKSLLKEYGVNLERFVELCQLRSAVLDIRSCQVLLHGSRDSIDKAKDILNKLSSNLDSQEEFSILSGGETCPVCACPAFNLTFRLQHCGHLYCNDCILGLVEQAQFPIQCCAENCSEDIVLDDIARVLEDDDAKFKKLLHSSLNNFLESNRSEIFYCPAPDCKMFDYKSDDDERWLCPLCQNEICKKCNVVYHYGFTCDVYQGSKTDPDFSFKVWKKGTTECKECPRCKTAIEKNEGCDHMTCISCKAHFCWVCCREFSTEREVYSHIPFCDMYPKW